MRVATIAAIRDARGLTPEQKTILYTVEGRGEVFSTRDRFRADCGGMSKSRLYRHMNPLIEKGLLDARVRRPRGTTVYRVNHDAVAAMIPMEDETPNVLKTGTLQNEDTNVPVSKPPMSWNRDAKRPQNEDTKENTKGYPVRGNLKSLIRVSELPPFTEEERDAIASRASEEFLDLSKVPPF